MSSLKIRNRILSIVYMLVFSAAIVTVVCASIKVIKEYKYREELIAQKEELENEKNWQKEINDIIDDEKYLSIYEKDNNDINNEDTTLLVFTK